MENFHGEIRVPFQPMATSVYVIAPSVTDLGCIRAFDYVMAPVIAFGQRASNELNTAIGAQIRAGNGLSHRDQYDPPAGILPGGKPVATGDRQVLSENASVNKIQGALAWAVDGVVIINNRPPKITAGPNALDNPVTGETGRFTVSATDPDGDTLTYAWSATGPDVVTFTAPSADGGATATFRRSGDYMVSVTISDDRGGQLSSSVPVRVQAIPSEVVVSP